MLIYLDTCILIYWVEGPAPFATRVRTHIAKLQAADHRFAVSDFTSLESLVKPFGKGDGQLLIDYERLLLAPTLTTVALTAAVYRRAAHIRGVHSYAGGRHYSVQDSLHLAAAIESRCDSLLTNDQRLSGFPDLAVDLLP